MAVPLPSPGRMTQPGLLEGRREGAESDADTGVSARQALLPPGPLALRPLTRPDTSRGHTGRGTNKLVQMHTRLNSTAFLFGSADYYEL